MSPASLWQGARRVAPAQSPQSAVLLLHGLGSNADDVIGLAPYLAPRLPQTVFISPNAPQACDMGPYGYQWFSLRSWTAQSMWNGAAAAAPALEGMIKDVQAEFGLPLNRIALVGFSQGAMMSLHVGLRLPEPVAGIIALSGALLGEEQLAAEIRSRPPVLLAHGQQDEVVPYAALLAAQGALQRNNVPVEALTRPLMGHNIDDMVLQASADFLAKHLADR